MELIYITNSADQAVVLQGAGVDTVMVDLEINGKDARQGHLNTVISRHAASDISTLRPVLAKTQLMVRVNPVFDGSGPELDDVIARGADSVMLPMFTHPDDVLRFADLVAGRVPITLLLETPQALVRMPRILATEAFSDIHLGLNDLHLGLGLDFMFELMSEDVLGPIAQTLNANGTRFGIGGLARLGQGRLPAELILSEHLRLGSNRAILARDFQTIFAQSDTLEAAQRLFAKQVTAIQKFVLTPHDLLGNHRRLTTITRSIASEIRAERSQH